MSGGALEIERKYRLAAAPDPRVLASHGARAYRIEQVYLVEPPSGRRVRRIEGPDGAIEHRFTRKTHLRGLVREELEHEIDAAAYADYLTEADLGRSPIRKVRHVVPYGDQRLEVDVFDQPPGLVLVEVELRSETELVDLPDWLGEHRDVSEDPAYANASLARIGTALPPYGVARSPSVAGADGS